jgi:hypothetical protein
MKVLQDYQGLSVRLTDERLAHILEHPEMKGMEARIAETLMQPQQVIESLSNTDARLYYRFYIGTRVGNKNLCVVIKVLAKEAFVITAYLTDTIKKGNTDMAQGKVKIWYDREGDYLEVIFDQRAGYFRETAYDQVMEKVDDAGNVLGFSVLKVSALQKTPLEVAL